MAGTDGVRLGAVARRSDVAARITARTGPLEVTPPDRQQVAPVAAGTGGFLTAEVCWEQVERVGTGLPHLAFAAFALVLAARRKGVPLDLGLLDQEELRVVGAADGLRLPALADALADAPKGTAATVTIAAGGPGLASVQPPEGAGWGVLTVGSPSVRARATSLADGDWGVGVALLGPLALTYRAGHAADAASVLDRVTGELERRDWRNER